LLDHSSGRSSSCALLLLGLLCQQDGAEAVEAAPDQGEGDAALESVDAVIGAHVQAVHL